MPLYGWVLVIWGVWMAVDAARKLRAARVRWQEAYRAEVIEEVRTERHGSRYKALPTEAGSLLVEDPVVAWEEVELDTGENAWMNPQTGELLVQGSK